MVETKKVVTYNIARFDFRRFLLSELHLFTFLWESNGETLPKQRRTGNRTSGIVHRSCDPDADHPKETHRKFVVVIYFLSFFSSGGALLDLMIRCDEPPPSPGKRVLCRHPFDETKRAYVCPSHVEPLYHVYWKDGKVRLYILNYCTTNQISRSECFHCL